jgi:hypothetical protein
VSTPISDESMQSLLAGTREYTVVVLYAGPEYGRPDTREIAWEHGRRNFSLRADGIMPIVVPVLDESEICGVAVLTVDPAEAAAALEQDPGVRAGVFTYSVHPGRSFPGDALP